MKYFILASLLLGVALAKCPNACSGHGECGKSDACACYSGFQGGDCSERVCMYNWAWVTTAIGDQNYDGDVYDGTVYSTSSALNPENLQASIGVGGSLLQTQASPGGTWESWPYSGKTEEGHFYMECSNRGLCDRTKGDCTCFDGFTGTSCNRMVCPEDCSEHGTCVTVGSYDSTYPLWDKEMARSCKCDPGYTGPSCATRMCPLGNDVLTRTNELSEIQYVDIFSVCSSVVEESTDTLAAPDQTVVEGCTPGAGETAAPWCAACVPLTVADQGLGGYARLTMTTNNGETYTTSPFGVLAAGDAYQNSISLTDIAAGAQAALRALPNNVTSETLLVKATYCEALSDTLLDGTAGDGAGDYIAWRTLGIDKVYTGTEQAVPYGTADLSGNTATDVVGSLGYPWCIRLKVSFKDMPGDITDLGADVTDVTFLKKTNFQHGLTSTVIGKQMLRSFTTTQLQVNTGPLEVLSMKALYLHPPTNVVSAAATVSSGTPSTITFSGDLLHKGTDAGTYYPGEKLKVECEYDDPAGGATKVWRNLGTYTMSDSVDKNILEVDEYVLDCDSTKSGEYRVTSVSHVVSFGDVDITKITDLTGVTKEDAIRLSFITNVAAINFNAVVASSKYFEPLSFIAGTVYAANVGYVIIGEEDPTGSLGPGANGETVLDGTTSTVSINILSDGTMENTECGDRGICQEDGVCKCFHGYTGDSCSIQKSIAM